MATAGLLPAIRWVLPLLGLRVPPPRPADTLNDPTPLCSLPLLSPSPVPSHISRLPLHPETAQGHGACLLLPLLLQTDPSVATSQDAWGDLPEYLQNAQLNYEVQIHSE